MNHRHEHWKQRQADGYVSGLTLGHAAGIFGAQSVAAVRHRARRRGVRYAAARLRAAGIGLGLARVLLLGRP